MCATCVIYEARDTFEHVEKIRRLRNDPVNTVANYYRRVFCNCDYLRNHVSDVLHIRRAVQFITCDTELFHVLRYCTD